VRALNLVPPERLARQEFRRHVFKWSRLIGGAAVALGLSYALIAREVSARLHEMRALTDRYASLEERLRKADNLILERDELARHREAVANIRRVTPAVDLLDTIGAALTPEAYLTVVAVNRAPAEVPDAEPARASTVTVRGVAGDHGAVGAILRALRGTTRFESVDLVLTTAAPGDGDQGPVEFELAAVLRREAAP
jgi:Tfp pilus assembly protein PilN